MDESAARVAIDLSGRAFAQFTGRFSRESVGGLPTELVPHFFRSLGESLGAAIHIEVHGENAHHMVEACFKGFGRALRPALQRSGRDLPSTKGQL
jgi:imidazoleglycerol-phosphate dehydratase/histidinol-phosphatase